MPDPTKPAKRKLSRKGLDPASNETMTPSLTPTPEVDMEEVSAMANAAIPAPSYPSLASPPSGGSGLAKGGTQAVAAYQRKLNSMGAKLKVDGAWGKNTQAAFDQYGSPKTASRPAIKKAGATKVSAVPPTQEAANMAWAEQGKPKSGMSNFLNTEGKKGPIPRKNPLDEGLSTSDEAYERYTDDDAGSYPQTTSPSGQVGRRFSNGVQFYPNGRKMNPDGTMGNFSNLPRRKKTFTPSQAANQDPEYLKQEKPEAYRKMMEGMKRRAALRG